MKYIYIGIGGFLGAVGRYLFGELFVLQSGFPIAIVIINLLGSFLLGYLVEGFRYTTKLSSKVRLGITGGFLGGFTTFSTFSLDFVQLLKQQDILMAVVFLLSNIIGGLICAYLGLKLATYQHKVGAK